MSHTTYNLCWVITFQILPPFLRPRSRNQKKKKRQKRSKHSALDGYVSDQVHAVHGPSANLDAAGVAAWNIFWETVEGDVKQRNNKITWIHVEQKYTSKKWTGPEKL